MLIFLFKRRHRTPCIDKYLRVYPANDHKETKGVLGYVHDYENHHNLKLTSDFPNATPNHVVILQVLTLMKILIIPLTPPPPPYPLPHCHKPHAFNSKLKNCNKKLWQMENQLLALCIIFLSSKKKNLYFLLTMFFKHHSIHISIVISLQSHKATKLVTGSMRAKYLSL